MSLFQKLTDPRCAAMAIPFDQLPIGEGRHPTGEPGASFFLDRTELDVIDQEGPQWKLQDARFLNETVLEPDAIFTGSISSDLGDNFCYSVRVTHDPDDEEAQTLPRYGCDYGTKPE
jgi:hypothetical protein